MKKKINLKRILYLIAGLLIVLQFIRQEANSGGAYGPNDIHQVTQVPAEVRKILETSCYDCHSDHTDYPWYSQIQPVGMWLQHHVNEGKAELNFSQFANYKPKRQKHKMEEIVELVRAGEMPLASYTWIHGDAELTPKQQQDLVRWAESMYNGIVVPE